MQAYTLENLIFFPDSAAHPVKLVFHKHPNKNFEAQSTAPFLYFAFKGKSFPYCYKASTVAKLVLCFFILETFVFLPKENIFNT
jgi:hypothetical protein